MKHSMITLTILLLLLLPATLPAYELGEMGAGGYGGVGIPLGWLGDRLNPGITIGGNFYYSLDNLVPNLAARANINFMSFSGDRYASYYEYSFRDISFYVNGIYSFNLNIPLKPYVFAGIGLDFVTVEWDYYYYNDHTDSYDDTSVGEGFMAGGGAEYKPTSSIGVYAELCFHTSTYAAGAGFGDLVTKIVAGATYYFSWH